MPIYLIFIALAISTNAQTITRTATLTANQVNQNGVSIQNQSIDSTDSNSNIGYYWKISLGDNWKFMSDKISIITLEVDSDQSIDTNDRDFTFAFSQNDQKYFMTMIELESDTQSNYIYPACDASAKPSQSFATGDINAILNSEQYDQYDGQYYEADRLLKSSEGNYPLIIKLINNPIEGWSKWEYTNSGVSCGFEPFSSDQPLVIYVYSDDDIKSFRLTYEYIPSSTSAPTKTPTELPSASTTTVYPTVIEGQVGDDNAEPGEDADHREFTGDDPLFDLYVIMCIGITCCIGCIYSVRRKHNISFGATLECLQLVNDISMGDVVDDIPMGNGGDDDEETNSFPHVTKSRPDVNLEESIDAETPHAEYFEIISDGEMSRQ